MEQLKNNDNAGYSNPLPLVILLLLSVVIGSIYGYNCFLYYKGEYNYDGIRYAIYMLLFDVVFASLFFGTVKSYRKLGIWILAIAILQNLNLGTGIEILPFSGTVLSFVTIVLILFKVGPFRLS